MMRLAFLLCGLLLATPAAALADFDDERRAGAGPDSIATGRGADLVNGGSGADELAGGRGDDVLVDTAGRDDARGGRGDDRVLVRDGNGGDTVHCGPGEDVAVVDPGDHVADDCEISSKDWPQRVRQDAKDLTAREKADVVEALLMLKATPSPYDAKLPWYDQYTDWHEQAFSGNVSAHQSAAFLPWHREFLLQLESALQVVSGKPIALPYWDWTDAASTAAVFSDELMGPNGDPQADYAVTSGPFRKGAWRLFARDEGGVSPFVPGIDQPAEGRWIERAMGTEDVPAPSPEGVAAMLSLPTYDAPSWNARVPFASSFRSALEAGNQTFGAHNSIHVLVGGYFEIDGVEQSGTMALATSPNDPVFWLHHNNIDRLWDEWSTRHGEVYLPVRGGRTGINRNDTMEPFEAIGVRRTPGDLLATEPLDYRFATRAPGVATARVTQDPSDSDLHELAQANGLLCVL